MSVYTEELETLLAKWQAALLLKDWDVHIKVIHTPWRKTGNVKIDAHDEKALLLVNGANPRGENLEEVVHELLHLKLWGLDRMLVNLLEATFGSDEQDPKYKFAYAQFMDVLEPTVEDLTKACLQLGGERKELSFGRVQALVDEEV